MRFFPLPEWTELDVWPYIGHQHIEAPALYFASMYPVVEPCGPLILSEIPKGLFVLIME